MKTAEEFAIEYGGSWAMTIEECRDLEELVIARDASVRRAAMEECCKFKCGFCLRGVRVQKEHTVYYHYNSCGVQCGTCAAADIRDAMAKEAAGV